MMELRSLAFLSVAGCPKLQSLTLGYCSHPCFSHAQLQHLRRSQPQLTFLSMINTFKSPLDAFSRSLLDPPSLLFLLMTLGPALLLLAAADAWRGLAGDVLALIGRVPLFYYLLHLGVIHALALIIGTLAGFEPSAFLTAWPFLPRGWGYGPRVIFAVWAAAVLALYPACRWFAAVKAGRPDSWLRYL